MVTVIPSEADLAIIGGGINGAGIAALASNAGLKVVLFEKGDFASGTSSKSTKLIHGGIRYLEQMRFSLVFESLQERYNLLETVPHLVRPLPFLLPSFAGDERPAWMLRLGMTLYDLLAGRRNIHSHRWLKAPDALSIAPGLNPTGLYGCGLYYDAQVNDSRLVLENILAAQSRGALCLNDCPITKVDYASRRRMMVQYHHLPSDTHGTLTTRCVANTTGPWANQVSRMIIKSHRDLVRPTRGTHIVMPQLISDYAVLGMSKKDRRIFFVIPWRGYSLVGTTDLDDKNAPDMTIPTEAEILYLLKETVRLFPETYWSRDKVIASFAGLRPLAWSAVGHASSVSREDKIIREGPILTVLGGKLTTYRSMARKGLKAAESVLGVPFHAIPFPILPGAPSIPWQAFLLSNIPQWTKEYGISPGQAGHLASLYGERAVKVLELIKDDPTLIEPLHARRPEIMAQVAFAAIHEMSLHLSDVMLRRLEIGYSPQRTGEADEKASRLMAGILNWSEDKRRQELQSYRDGLFPKPT